MTKPRIESPYELTISTANGGLNKDTHDLVVTWSTDPNSNYEKENDQSHPRQDTRNGLTKQWVDDWWLNIDEVFLWMNQIVSAGRGGDIYDYSGAYHELDDPTKEVPQQYRDLTGDPPGTDWMSWATFGDSHVPIQIGDFWYRSMLVGQSGTPMPCSLWYDFVRQPNTNQTGINRMINRSEFLEIQAAAGEPEPQQQGGGQGGGQGNQGQGQGGGRR